MRLMYESKPFHDDLLILCQSLQSKIWYMWKSFCEKNWQDTKKL